MPTGPLNIALWLTTNSEITAPPHFVRFIVRACKNMPNTSTIATANRLYSFCLEHVSRRSHRPLPLPEGNADMGLPSQMQVNLQIAHVSLNSVDQAVLRVIDVIDG